MYANNPTDLEHMRHMTVAYVRRVVRSMDVLEP